MEFEEIIDYYHSKKYLICLLCDYAIIIDAIDSGSFIGTDVKLKLVASTSTFYDGLRLDLNVGKKDARKIIKKEYDKIFKQIEDEEIQYKKLMAKHNAKKEK